MGKLKLALYWGASCGGCEIAQLQIGEKILKVVEAAEIVFWPVAIDVKYKDVEAMGGKSIDVCLFNGGIRNSEQEHIARLLREKSKVLIAYGACAYSGGLPGMANLLNKDTIFERVYREAPFVDNNDGILPQTAYKVPEGESDLFGDNPICQLQEITRHGLEGPDLLAYGGDKTGDPNLPLLVPIFFLKS